MAAAVPYIGLAIAAAATTHSVESSRQAGREADRAKEIAGKDADALKKQTEGELAEASRQERAASRQTATRRGAGRSPGRTGRAGTILGAPAPGVTGGGIGGGGGKTTLGS
jgi:hypothetical protein